MNKWRQLALASTADQEYLGLRQGMLVGRKKVAYGLGKLHLHMAVSGCFLLLALAGWGAFTHAAVSQKNIEAELRREVNRLTAERDRLIERQRAISVELGASKAELAMAQKGMTGFMKALENSRSEISAAQQQLETLRQQAQRRP